MGRQIQDSISPVKNGGKSLFENRFNAALSYRDKRKKLIGEGKPHLRDLELETILEIIEGKRLIHCHSYRQDEILVFLRTMESFGVRVASLQHVLEGYKVADEIARHGAGASTFLIGGLTNLKSMMPFHTLGQ